MPTLVGFIASSDEAFQQEVIKEINNRKVEDIKAEYCKISETIIGEESRYRVIVDRLSHVLKYYREYLKVVSLSGTYVINNPFRSFDDKFFSYGVAEKIGINVPKTVALPSKRWGIGGEEISNNRYLANLIHPLDWDWICEYVGFPAILKACASWGWRNVHKVNNMDELMDVYNNSGTLVMMLQEYIEPEHYVRAFVLGKKYVLPIKYDPVNRQYIVDHKHLSDELGRKIVEDSLKINIALDYDMNTVEFSIRDGIPYAIDFVNIVPDTRPEHINEIYFEWLVKHMATVMIDYALSKERSTYWDTELNLVEEFIRKEQERREKEEKNSNV